MKCVFQFLLRSEVKGIELHFGSWHFSDGHRREGACGLPSASALATEGKGLWAAIGLLTVVPAAVADA